MNQKEYLLTCFIEELLEVGHAISKTMRFGLNDAPNPDVMDNETYIKYEFAQVTAIIEMLKEMEGIDIYDLEDIDEVIEEKREKVLQFMEYSKERGCLNV